MDTTLPDDSLSDSQSRAVPDAIVLSIIWSVQSRHCGRILLVPPISTGHEFVFGRGEVRADDPHSRLVPLEDCQGTFQHVAPFDSPKISRVQASVRRVGAAALLVKNLGRCRMLHNELETQQATVSPGHVLQFGSQLLLLCSKRPAWSRTPDRRTQPAAFGEADANGIVGESAPVSALRRQIQFVAPLDDHVLITGASGTGKELVANAIHAASKRARSPIVARNAATFPEALVDAELFGNRRNYPNHGMSERPGIIGQADGSTLFLDEIAELPLGSQTHLLRVLDAGEYQRLGDAATRKADLRVVAATNRPEQLREDVAARFKLRIHCPSLGERREDIPLLAIALLRDMASRERSLLRFFPDGVMAAEPRITLACMSRLVRHQYVGNVRELAAKLLDAITCSPGNSLEPPHESAEASPAVSVGATEAVDPASVSPAAVVAALEKNGWIVERTWRELGLASRHVLTRLMSKYSLRRR